MDFFDPTMETFHVTPHLVIFPHGCIAAEVFGLAQVLVIHEAGVGCYHPVQVEEHLAMGIR